MVPPRKSVLTESTKILLWENFQLYGIHDEHISWEFHSFIHVQQFSICNNTLLVFFPFNSVQEDDDDDDDLFGSVFAGVFWHSAARDMTILMTMNEADWFMSPVVYLFVSKLHVVQDLNSIQLLVLF